MVFNIYSYIYNYNKLYLFCFADHERVGCVRKTSLKKQEKSGSGQRGEANKRTEGRKKGRKERAAFNVLNSS